MPIRVVLVDDHPVVRKGLNCILAPLEDIQIIGETGDGSEAVQMVVELSPDVVILDLDLPGFDGIEVVRQLKDKSIMVKILVLCEHHDHIHVNGVFALGASGYLLKDEDPEMIIKAIRGAAKGESGWISQRVVSQMMNHLNGDSNVQIKFTARETQVLEAIVSGKTNQEIAFGLQISIKTVEKYVFSILSKLGVASRVEAAVVAVKNGWI